jgi:hypothetical protein
MGLPWVRLDTQFAQNPKLARLAATGKWRAAFAYVASIAYAGAQGTDGYIPSDCLVFVHAMKSTATDLVKAGLWVEDHGGWSINGWDEFQVVDEAAKRRSDKARKASMKRWHGDEA